MVYIISLFLLIIASIMKAKYYYISLNLNVSCTYSKHATWMRAYTGIMKNLEVYVGSYHTSGLQWNAEVLSVQYCVCRMSRGAMQLN